MSDITYCNYKHCKQKARTGNLYGNYCREHWETVKGYYGGKTR